MRCRRPCRPGLENLELRVALSGAQASAAEAGELADRRILDTTLARLAVLIERAANPMFQGRYSVQDAAGGIQSFRIQGQGRIAGLGPVRLDGAIPGAGGAGTIVLSQAPGSSQTIRLTRLEPGDEGGLAGRYRFTVLSGTGAMQDGQGTGTVEIRSRPMGRGPAVPGRVVLRFHADLNWSDAAAAASS